MSQPNLIMELGAHSSLHENCHHQLVYAKFDLEVSCSPPYQREIWHYQHANIDQIKRAIEQFPWEYHLEIFPLMKWSIYSTKLSKAFSPITFPMKQLLVMIETHLGLTARLNS